MSYFTVRVYMQDMAYGGPEEGGWYYTYGKAASEFGHMTRAFKTRDAARLYLDEIGAEIDAANKGRRPISSVLSDGVYAAMIYEGEAPMGFPAEVPHYE